MFVPKFVSVLGAAALAALMVTQAQAVTITNRDAIDYELRIEEGGDEMVGRSVTIPSGETLNLCEDGCTMELDNGESESFEGDETVELFDGNLVFIE
ncbi:MAG: hypothetical protein ACLFPA_03000 [Dichotomicrobium sp.]